MTCEQFDAILMDALAGGDRSELDAHLATCERCRGEAASLERVWDDLGRLPAATPDPALRDRVLGAARARRATRWPARLALAASLVVVGALLGVAASSWMRSGPQPAPPGDQYVMMLYEAPERARAASDPTEAESVEEHRTWARRLHAAGALVGGEKLAPEREVLAPEAAGAPAGATLGGYFVILAPSFEEAVADARTCPHFVRGGAVEVRRIDPV